MMEFANEQLEFFRMDLETDFAYSKQINATKAMFRKEGRDFDKEFAEWQKLRKVGDEHGY